MSDKSAGSRDLWLRLNPPDRTGILRDYLNHRFTRFRDDEWLTFRCFVDQFLELRLGFVDVDSLHQE